jgi:hypothetical protein
MAWGIYLLRVQNKLPDGTLTVQQTKKSARAR